jgi:hypothetical protein
VPDTSREKLANTIFRNAIFIVFMASAKDIVHLNHKVSKNGVRQNVFIAITDIDENHRVPSVSSSRDAPATRNRMIVSRYDRIAFTKNMAGIVAAFQAAKKARTQVINDRDAPKANFSA